MEIEFGAFLREKRKERHFTIKILANLIGKSTSYVSQLESGLRVAPKMSVVEKISDALVLDEFEKRDFLDLAEKSRNTLTDDMNDYINSHENVKKTLSFSKNCDVPEEEWQHFLKRLKNKFMI